MIPVTGGNVAEVAEKLKLGELPAPAKSLAEAMHRVMEAVDYVQKKGTVTVGQGYKFASEAEFIAKLRPELVRQQITLCPVDMQPLFLDVVQGKSGPQNRVVLRVTFRFTHAPTKDTLDVVTCGEGMDAGDKATNKAMTGAMKYALRQAFVIETGSDPDETPSHTQQRADQPKPYQAQPQKPANTALRAKYAQALARCKDREEYAKVCADIGADFKAGLLTAEDRAALGLVAKDMADKFAAKA